MHAQIPYATTQVSSWLTNHSNRTTGTLNKTCTAGSLLLDKRSSTVESSEHPPRSLGDHLAAR